MHRGGIIRLIEAFFLISKVNNRQNVVLYIPGILQYKFLTQKNQKCKSTCNSHYI